uniref:non-specific serine/threonine protein kinase n=1 Tax=Oryza glumipatula TaxID=40148 RepID=A0A0E0ASK1_9ORYZ
MPPYMIPLCLIPFIIQASHSMGAQINETTIPEGSEINIAGPQSWVSPSGRFAFGFYPEGEGFSIGVWLVTDPSRFIMWTAFRNDPPVSGGSILLTAGGSLQWIPPNQGFQGKVISAAPTSATSAAILDTGNFVLYDAKKQVAWSTFGTPTDTLLPGQNLPPGNQLFSSVSDTNHAIGKYRISNQPDGNLVMYPIGAIDPNSAYWNTGTYAQNFLLTLTLDPNGTLWLFNRNSPYRMVLFLTNQSLSASPESESYYHLTLDADGILRLYSHVFFKQGGAPKTKVEWLVPPSNDRCSVKGVCGPNSFCQVTSSGETRCSCLPGFEFLSANRSTQGCRRAQTAIFELSTNGYAEELGMGAYGTVFKGVLTNSGNNGIVVERLERMAEDGEREFQREVRAIARTHHRNLVRLLGFCNEGAYRLVYEYMPNGSLANLLFKRDATLPSWSNRIAIALDVARGLQYLHEEIEVPIIHCDIKPENILIDSSGMAKIADFGLAKLLIGNQTKTFTGVRGTRGYLAPEWSKNTAITVKVDIYSFGVMLLEIISCRKSMALKLAGEECNISEWAYEYMFSGEMKEVAAGKGVDEVELERMVKIGIWCTQDEPVARPAMKSVVQMMEGSVQVQRPPPPASFSQSLR